MNKENVIGIEVEKVANELAIEAWVQETGMIPESDLYETIIVKEGIMPWENETKKEVRAKWSTLFFNLRDRYIDLLESFKKG